MRAIKRWFTPLVMSSLFFSTNTAADWNGFFDDAVKTTKKACIWCDKTLSELKEDFRGSISEFDEQKIQVASGFNETKELVFSFSSLLQKSKNENTVFGQLHDRWEASESEIKDIQSTFTNLVESADEYFSEVETRANTINDESLRGNAFNEIRSKKKKYVSRLQLTRASLVRLDAANIKIKDVMTYLEINYSLKSLDEELSNRFVEIDNTINTVMKELDLLSIESQELLNET